MHPREIGKYRIVKLLPVGGMGRVYLTLDKRTNRPLALKLIDLGPGPDQKEIVEAERRGAILQARLCGLDSRIVRVNSYGELEDFFYIEMEYVEGQDLSELLGKGPLGALFAARIAADICEVLHHAHTFSAEIEGQQYRGIVHGDIKPRNVRITPDGQVRVLDFGIAKALSLTRKFTQNQFGSSQYSSPERLNTGEVDIASDLWSVGVVLFETATARPYFEAESGAKLDRLIRGYDAVQELPSTLPAPLQTILRRALAVDPSRRYSSTAAFAGDLRAFVQGRAVPPAPEDFSNGEDEVTRRTTIDLDEAPTRRTSTPVGSQLSPADVSRSLPASAKAQTSKSLTPQARKIRFFAGLAVSAILAAMFWNEYAVWSRGNQLERELETERLTDLNAAWARYETLAKRSYLPVLLSGTRNAVQRRLTSVADRVIDEYRSTDAPAVNEGDWHRAQASLARALELDPDDNTVRGKLYICEGHLNRIRADARHLPKLYYEARARFDQARELLPKSPDPYLGLARLYAYALRDVDKAEEALRQADKRGHEMGRREKAQIADAYRDRAEKLVAEANRSGGLPEEGDFLKRAQKDFDRAQQLYRDIVPFGGSAANLRKSLDYMADIDGRLQAIKEKT